MAFSLRSDVDTPLYLQIREGLRREIVAGTMAPGNRLPSTRQLASDLRVSRITVANAYAELEAEGLIEAKAGSGTFVLPSWNWTLAQGLETVRDFDGPSRWQERLRDGPSMARDQVLREALRSPATDGIVSFAGSRGDVRLFPAAEFRRTITQVLHEDGAVALDYELSEGYLPLRQALARYLWNQGICAGPKEILITAGAQQAIELVARALLEPGDRVIVESPTYPGALVTFESRRAVVIGVPLDAEGMQADALEREIERTQPRLIYTVPTFHNPTGCVMSASRRCQVVRLAHQYGVPILEDEYLREVRFGNPIPPPLAICDRYGDVIHVGSFSKSLMPSLRLGYVVARGPILERLVAFRRALDICSSALLQRALCRYLESGAMHSHWKRVSRVYRRRQAVMNAALRRHFPAGARWTTVDGGLVLWVEVPPGISVARLFHEAQQAGISFAVGEAFFPRSEDQPFMRLNFAALDEARIERGVGALGELLRRQLKEQERGDDTARFESGAAWNLSHVGSLAHRRMTE